MEPKDSEFDFTIQKTNDSENKGKEVELIQNFDSKKRKMSSWENGSSSNEIHPTALDPVVSGSNKKSFSCKFCDKKFSSSQALGGHQNAHKEERALAKSQNNPSFGRFEFASDNFYPYSNMGYFSYRAPYYQDVVIPRFNEPYRQPSLAHNGLGFLGLNGSRFIPMQADAFSPSNVIPEENYDVCADYDMDENSNSGCVFDVVGCSNGVKNDKEDLQDEEGSIDLTLKL